MGRVGFLTVLLLLLLPPMGPATLAAGPISSPASAVRFYQGAIARHQCDLAAKLLGASHVPLGRFRHSCRAVQGIAIERLVDPGYRIAVQNATYACIALRYTETHVDGSAVTYGGWYMLESTGAGWWRILLAQSHITAGGAAVALTRAVCASHLPSYTRPASRRVISGSAFLSSRVAWIALSTSAAYVSDGGCDRGVGRTCDTAKTVIERTNDGGLHWQRILSFTATPGAPIWLRPFTPGTGMVAADLPGRPGGPARSALFRTSDGGRHWQRFSPPGGALLGSDTISFPDPRHGWVWYGNGAAGSMAVDIYRTADGGGHWRHITCTHFSGETSPHICAAPSGIDLGGDKAALSFRDPIHGWLTAFENSGIPDLYHTSNGGSYWHRQPLGLPPGVHRPGVKGLVFPLASFSPPRFFGQEGILAESVTFVRSRPTASWQHLYLYRSHNGGQTWHFLQRAPAARPSYPESPIQPIDAHHWLMLAHGMVWSTADGGRSWAHQPSDLPMGRSLVVVDFNGPRYGWAITQSGGSTGGYDFGTALLQTADGGMHWHVVPLPASVL